MVASPRKLEGMTGRASARLTRLGWSVMPAVITILEAISLALASACWLMELISSRPYTSSSAAREPSTCGSKSQPFKSAPTKRSDSVQIHTITLFYGSSCANNGKGAPDTPEIGRCTTKRTITIALYG
eukprot:8596004-Pyramimonas_sp.AAC.2